MKLHIAALVLVPLATVFVLRSTVHAQPSKSVWDGVYTEEQAKRGAPLYSEHCASCHGLDGTGNGPMARTLRHAPPDLTRLSQRNAGVFPSARVRRIVEGRDVESHGDRDMPVWGDAFRSRPGTRSGDDDAVRIAAIVRYLESIQNRDAH